MTTPKDKSNASCSSDLEHAKQLSRALSGLHRAQVEASATAYVSFAPHVTPTATPVPEGPRTMPPAHAQPRPGAGAVRAPSTPPPTGAPFAQSRPSTPPMPRREVVSAPVMGYGPAQWNQLLDACLVATRAQSAFLMDPSGLVIVSRGTNTEALEVVGSRLMLAFDQADRIGDEKTLAMTVESTSGTLWGLRLTQPGDGALLLGLVVPGGLSAERQHRVHELVTQVARPVAPVHASAAATAEHPSPDVEPVKP